MIRSWMKEVLSQEQLVTSQGRSQWEQREENRQWVELRDKIDNDVWVRYSGFLWPLAKAESLFFLLWSYVLSFLNSCSHYYYTHFPSVEAFIFVFLSIGLAESLFFYFEAMFYLFWSIVCITVTWTFHGLKILFVPSKRCTSWSLFLLL